MSEKVGVLSKIFSPIKWVLGLINNYFKAFIFLLLLYLIFGGGVGEGDLVKPNLASIEIHGTIMDAQETLEKIQKAKKDTNIKGVLLHVNSPGGALAPSVEIAYAIKDLAKQKPVVAYAAGTMASGSYYASIWSDRIFANPGSFIGSIGVIFQGFNIEPLAKKIGIEAQSIKAGEYKEAGTFMRPWTPKEKESLEKLINSSYNLFVSDVARARDLNITNKNSFANARVFLASEAKKVKLIDEVGTLQDAQKYLVQKSGVKSPKWQKPDKFDRVIEKFAKESSKTLIDAFYGLKAY